MLDGSRLAGSPGGKWPPTTWATLLGIAAVIAFIVCLAATRSQFNVGIEVDTHVTYIPEARRLASFDTLEVKYHLPGYPFALGLVFLFFKDWLVTGLVVSVLASAFSLIAAYHVFKRIWGPQAGLGAVAGLVTSAEFLSYGAQASSDIPYLAMYVGSLVFGVRAWQTARRVEWFYCGLFVAAAILTRTSGIALLPLLLMPLFIQRNGGRRLTMTACAWAGFLLLACVWGLYGLATNTPLLPQENHVNLALTYYTSGTRNTAEGMQAAAQMFSSTADVLLADPARVLRIYWLDLLSLPGAIATELVWPPVAILGLFGVWALWRDRREPTVIVLVAVTLASLFLLNLHSFAPRFHFYLLPLFGALAGMSCVVLLRSLAHRPALARMVAGAATTVLLIGAVQASITAKRKVMELENLAEFGESIPAVARLTELDATIVTRKFVVPNYARRERINFPDVDNMSDMCKSIRALVSGRPAYLYVGREERSARPKLVRELESASHTPWLMLVESRELPAPWRLYRIMQPVNCD